MKIERGILGVNLSNEIIVRSPMNVYSLSKESLLERKFRSNEKLLGVVIDDKFHRCEEFELSDGKKIFGYIKNNNLSDSKLTIQSIKYFNKKTFNPFDSIYELGIEITIGKTNLINYYND